jgi:hypothetical protein
MVFKTPRMHSLRPQIKLYGQAVPNVQRFKFLGLWLVESMNMHSAVVPLKFAAYQAWRTISVSPETFLLLLIQ